MAYTSEQITALESAIAEGALRVKYADKEVEYRPLDDMIRILNIMKAQVEGGQVGGRKLAAFNKGT